MWQIPCQTINGIRDREREPLNKYTLRKKSPPDGRIMRCDPGSTLSGSPSLYQEIIGDGTPSALQFNVAGSYRGTITSNGCSTILGEPMPVNWKNRENIKISFGKWVTTCNLSKHLYFLSLSLQETELKKRWYLSFEQINRKYRKRRLRSASRIPRPKLDTGNFTITRSILRDAFTSHPQSV